MLAVQSSYRFTSLSSYTSVSKTYCDFLHYSSRIHYLSIWSVSGFGDADDDSGVGCVNCLWSTSKPWH